MFRARTSRKLSSGKYRSRVTKVTYTLRTLTVWFQITTGTKQGGTFCHDFEVLSEEVNDQGILVRGLLAKFVEACELPLTRVMPSNLFKKVVVVVVDKGIVSFEVAEKRREEGFTPSRA